jgi:methyl-accepting chemotaxis protein
MQLSIRAKLMGGFVLILLLLGAVSYAALSGISSLVASYAEKDRINQTVALSYQVEAAANQQVADVRGYLLTREQTFRTGYEAQREALRTATDQFADLIRSAEAKQLLENLRAAVATFDNTVSPVLERAVFTSSEIDDLIKEKLRTPRMALDEAAQALITYEQRRLKEVQAQADKTQRLVLVEVLGAAALATVLGIGLALFLSGRLAKPIRQTAEAARRLATGDLTVDELAIHSRDEVGELSTSFNQMVKQLRTLIHAVHVSSESIAAAAAQLSQNTQQVAEVSQSAAGAITQVASGATNQARSVEQASQIVEELRNAIDQIAAGAQDQARQAQQSAMVVADLGATVEDVAAKAQNVTSSSTRALETAQAGNQAVARSIAGMERIQASVLSAADGVKDLERLSSQIGAITAVITEIADQTDLLALNAAIEAARAGEHGRGFAVVADEVRKLAERAGSSAKEIADLISSIQTNTAAVVAAMEQGQSDVAEGTRLTAEAGGALTAILQMVEQTMADANAILGAAEQIAAANRGLVEAVDSVAAVTEENTAATEEMAAGSEQMVEAIQAIAGVSRENAAAAEEVAASMEEVTASAEEIASSAQALNRIAEDLQQHVGKFKL